LERRGEEKAGMNMRGSFFYNSHVKAAKKSTNPCSKECSIGKKEGQENTQSRDSKEEGKSGKRKDDLSIQGSTDSEREGDLSNERRKWGLRTKQV